MNGPDLIRSSCRKAFDQGGFRPASVVTDADTRARPLAASAIDRMAANFLASVDLSRLGRIRYRGAHDVISPGRVKYVDGFRHWVWRNAQRIHEAGLDRGPSRILELGSGGCIFAAMCRRLGHEVVATDKDRADTIFRELSGLLGVTPELLKVEPLQPLPTRKWGRFDVVAAYALCFNSNGGDPTGRWGESQWRFFFDDLRRNVLAGSGRVVLKFNHEHELRPAVEGQVREKRWRNIEVRGRTVSLQT